MIDAEFNNIQELERIINTMLDTIIKIYYRIEGRYK